LYYSFRPGGIDLLVKSLASQTMNSFELIVVDDYPGRVERGLARKYAEEAGIKVRWWGVSKPKSYPETKCGGVNAVNTGLIHACTPIVCFVNDYTFLAPDAVQIVKNIFVVEWLMGARFLLHGASMIYDSDKPLTQDDVDTWPGGQDPNIRPMRPHVPKEFEGYYFMGQIGFFELINGFDERSDDCGPWNLTSLIAQAKLTGWGLRVCDSLVIHMIDHRRWGGWSPGLATKDSMWRTDDHHTSGEAAEEPEWLAQSPNPYNLADLRMLSRTKADLAEGRDVYPHLRLAYAGLSSECKEAL
jgi:glycosyltransferase involved in cell wall biosynthesis